MPRGKKASFTLEERLDNITKAIEQAESNLKELKKEKKDLEAQIEAEELATLRAAIKEKGLSLEDAIAKINEVQDDEQ
jgi:predicted  nucleic acid-binding Zn-ribbon protein